MLELLIYIGVGLLTVSIPVIYFIGYRLKSHRASKALQDSIDSGLIEPISIHPYINTDICIGSISCVAACPETNVLGAISNRGVLINPSHCIGHGECQAACPVDAITLVFGTETRGVDIPHISGKFETNVPGIYIAGELGGMGLIRNAVKQGWEATRYISDSLQNEQRVKDKDVIDVCIVGAGPAGISASLQAMKDGLSYITVDQDDLGGTVLTYPRRKLVMTHPMELPLYGKVKFREIEKEQLLNIFLDVCSKTGLSIRSGEKVTEINHPNGHFEIKTSKSNYLAKRVLLAIGRRGSPRKLGVPGEECSKVSYRLLDPEKFTNQKILVVGGGDSAVEAAVSLAKQTGNVVQLSYRGEQLFRIKKANKQQLDSAVKSNSIQLILNSNVTSILEKTVEIDHKGDSVILENDYIFVFVGGELPTEFLKKAGIAFTRKYGVA